LLRFWRQTDLAAPELREVSSASITCWLNRSRFRRRGRPALEFAAQQFGAVRLIEFLVGPLAPGTAVNMADALSHPACCGRIW